MFGCRFVQWWLVAVENQNKIIAMNLSFRSLPHEVPMGDSFIVPVFIYAGPSLRKFSKRSNFLVTTIGPTSLDVAIDDDDVVVTTTIIIIIMTK